MHSKAQRLDLLRKKIIEKVFVRGEREVWFYPKWPQNERNQVRGFFGTKDIVFLGLNPSYGHFPSYSDKFFYRQLRARRLQNAHITDLVKIRATGDELEKILADKSALNQQIDFLGEELGTIDPVIIVTLGSKCTSIFCRRFLSYAPKVIEIPHYSSIRRYVPKRHRADRERCFIEKIKEVKEKYRTMSLRELHS